MDISMKKTIKTIGIVALAIALPSCSVFKLGKSDKSTRFAPDMERIAILTGESNLEVDAEIASLPVVLPEPYRNQSWAQPGGNATNTAYHLDIADQLTKAWSSRVVKAATKLERYGSGPISANGMVYTMDIKATVYALNLGNGQVRWTTPLQKEDERSKVGYGGGVAYADGTIYATTGHGLVVALNANTGTEIWRYDGSIPFRNGPTISGNRVFGITIDNRIIAFNQSTGAVLWEQIGISETAGIFGGSAPAVSGNVVLAALSSGELVSFRVENGSSLWVDSLTRTTRLTPLATLADIDGNPVIDRGRVYAVSHAGSMVAIDMRTGQRAWESNVASIRTPAIAGNFGFVVTVDAEVAAISLLDGRVRWATKLQKYLNQEKRKNIITWTAPILAGDRILIASSHGYLLSLSPYTGEVLSAVRLPAGVTADPIVVDGTLVMMTDAGSLIAYR